MGSRKSLRTRIMGNGHGCAGLGALVGFLKDLSGSPPSLAHSLVTLTPK